MTHITTPQTGGDSLTGHLETLARAHGHLAVLRTALRLALARRRRPVGTEALCDHLRRDIGLSEADAPPPLPARIGPML